MADLGGIFDSAGDAVQLFAGAAGDLLTAGGYRAERNSYFKARDTSLQAQKIAEQNVQIEKASTAIKLAQTDREVYQVTGGQRADIAAAGLSNSGSAMDVIRSSAGQGALQKALISDQGQINANAYSQQATSLGAQAQAYEGQAYSADAAGSAQTAAAAGKGASGVLKTLGTIAGIAALFF